MALIYILILIYAILYHKSEDIKSEKAGKKERQKQEWVNTLSRRLNCI